MRTTRWLLKMATLGSLAVLAACGGDNPKPQEVEAGAELLFAYPADGTILTEADDIDPATDGIQFEARAEVRSTYEAVTVELVIDGSTTPAMTWNLPTGNAVEGSGEGTGLSAAPLEVLAHQVTFTEEGEHTLTARVLREGQLALQETVTVTVDLEDVVVLDPRVEITAPADGAELTADDDLDAGTPGLQIEVRATTTDIAAGTEMTLSVDGNEVQTLTTTAEGVLVFDAVLGDGDFTITVAGTVDVDGTPTDVTDSVSVNVETGACSVDVSPTPIGGACEFVVGAEDEDEGTDGLQTTFTVATDCAGAEVELQIDGVTVATDTATGGEATFAGVTLLEGDVVVEALVSTGDRTDTSTPLTFTVDTIAPTVTIGLASLGVVLPTDDRDNGSDGLQWDFFGTTDAGEDSIVEVLVDGVREGAGVAGFDGAWRVSDVTFEENAVYTITARATDACDNEGVSEPGELDVFVTEPPIAIIDPATGVILNAANDLDTETEGMQVEFTVEGEFDPGIEVNIECRTLPTAPYRPVDSGLLGEDGTVIIAATLEEGFNQCRAVVTDPILVRSIPNEFRVDSIIPRPFIREPEDGSAINDPTPTLSVVIEDTEVGEPLEAFYTLDGGDELPLTVEEAGVFEEIDLGEDGEKTITVRVIDEAGNEDMDTSTFLLDSEPPTLAVDFPTEGSVVSLEQLIDDGTEFLVEPTGMATGTDDASRACVRTRRVAERCVPVTTDGPVTFARVPVVPGDIVMTLELFDAAGNVDTEVVNFTVAVALPRLEIVSPEDGSLTTQTTGNTVVVETDLAAGLSVDLVVNGELSAVTATDDAGIATFTDVTLVPGENLLQANGADERGNGRSTVVSVTVDIEPPAIVFVSPVDGDRFNAASPDAAGSPGFQIDIAVTSDDAPDGSTATLVRTCGTTETTHEAIVDGGEVLFNNITVAELATCTLEVSATDGAGNVGTSSITIGVDRIIPIVTWLFPGEGTVLTPTNDISADPGIQSDVRLTVASSNAGQTVTLTVTPEDADTFTVESPALAGPSGEITFSAISFPDGVVRLSTRLEDDFGNVSRRNEILIIVASGSAGASIIDPLPGDTLNAADDTDTGTPGMTYDVRAAVTGSFDGFDASLCVLGGPTDGERCEAGGYFEIARSVVVGGATRFLDAPLPEGTRSYTAEIVLEDGTRVLGINQVSASIDSERPVVTAVEFLNDTNGDDILNLSESEDAVAGRAVVRVSTTGLADGRTVSVLSNLPAAGTVVGTGTVTSGVADVTVNLPEGGQVLSVRATDAALNPLAPGAPTIALTVDTRAPTLSFLAPMDAATLLSANDASADPGFQFNVRTGTDALDGREITITATVEGDITTIGVLTASGGVATGVLTIPQGEAVLLSASVSDLAGNDRTVSITVLVDSISPVVSFVRPAVGDTITLDAASDEDPGTPGIQVEVRLDIELAAVGQPIQILSDLTPTALATATVDGSSPQSVMVTVRVPGTHTLTARVTDIHGNRTDALGGQLDVTIDGCGINLPDFEDALVIYNAADDTDGNAANGIDVSISAEVLSAECDGLDAELYDGDTLLGSVTVAGGQATFAFTLADGATGMIEARIDDGETISRSPTFDYLVDLTAPVIGTVTPSDAGSATVLSRTSIDDAPAGVNFSVAVTGADAGTVEMIGASSLGSAPVAGGTANLAGVQLPEGEYSITFRATDAAGNTDEVSFDYLVDFTAPTAPTFTATVVTRRIGETRLNWTGNTANAATYEVRSAIGAIDEAAWDALDGDPGNLTVPAIDGALEATLPRLDGLQESFTIAMRAIDAAGNISPITTRTVFVGFDEESYSTTILAPQSVAALGDVNNDGFDDFALSGDDVPVVVVYGAADPSAATVQSIAAPAGAELFGRIVHGIGDVNGDTYDDILVTAPGTDSPGGTADTGAAYVWFGVASGTVASTPSVTIRYEGAANTQLGRSRPSGSGNFTDLPSARGIDDIVLSTFSDPGNAGLFVVLRGRTSWPATITIGADDAANYANGVGIVRAAAPGGRFGWTTNFVGDTDGDGYDDIVVANFGSALWPDGAVHFFYGRDMCAAPVPGTCAFPEAGLTSADADAGPWDPNRGSSSWSLYAIAGNEDLDGDEVPDFIVFDRINNIFDTFFGSDPMPTDISVSYTIASRASWGLGNRAALAGDLRWNYDDPGVGAPYSDIVLHAVASTGVEVLPYVAVFLNDGTGAFSVDSEVVLLEDAQLPQAVGDVNGDGYRDLVLYSTGDNVIRLYY